MPFDSTTFDRIQKSAIPNYLDTPDGLTFVDKTMHLVEAPAPLPIGVRTLTSVLTFIKSRKAGYMEGKIIHVEAPNRVIILEPHRDAANRTYAFLEAKASCSDLDSITDSWLPMEEFMVKLNTLFDVSLGDHAKVRAQLSSVTADSTLTLTDDGTSQNVALKSGIARKESGELPNPVMLAPFVTFPEITQPLLPFVLRLKKNNDAMLYGRLFPVESPGWSAECCNSVAWWLNGNLNHGPDGQVNGPEYIHII